MSFAELVDFLLANDVQLATDGGSLDYDAPDGVLTDELLAALREHKPALIAWLTAAPGADGVVVARAPVSYGQQRLWERHRSHPNPAVYNIRYQIELAGRLDPASLAAALNGVLARHSALRTRIVRRGRHLVQEVMAAQPLPLPVVQPADAAAVDGPFDLERAPLLRAQLVESGPGKWLLQLVAHHMVCDHTSMGIVLDELGALYTAAATGRQQLAPQPSPALEPSPAQYADYARWQRRVLDDGERRARLLSYWRSQLDGAALAPALRHDRPRPVRLSGRGDGHEFTVPAEVLDGLEALARRSGSTLHVVLLSAFAKLLGGIAGQADVVVITSFGNRLRTEHESIVGVFTDALPLRVQVDEVDEASAFADLVATMSRTLFAALDHQPMPLGVLVDAIAPHHAVPIPTVLFTVLSADEPNLTLPAVTATVSSAVLDGAARMELYVILQPRVDGLAGHVEYSTDVFDADTVERHTTDFVRLLTQVAAHRTPAVRAVDKIEN